VAIGVSLQMQTSRLDPCGEHNNKAAASATSSATNGHITIINCHHYVSSPTDTVTPSSPTDTITPSPTDTVIN
jgi:hypothetical protein